MASGEQPTDRSELRDGQPSAGRALAGKLRSGASALRYLPRTLSLTWRAAPGHTALWLVLLLAQGVLPAAAVQLTRRVVDALLTATQGSVSPSAFQPVLTLLLLYAAVLILGEGLRAVSGWVRAAQAERVQDFIQDTIHAQAVAADLAFFERPEFHDRLHRATWESAGRSVALLETLGGLLQSSVTLLTMMVVILPYGVWLPLALLVSTLPAFYVVVRYAVRLHLWWTSITEAQRRIQYHDGLLTSGEMAAEVRLYDLGGHFRGIYQSLRRRLREGRLQIEAGHAWVDFGASLSALVVAGLAMGWMAWRAVNGALSLGELALFFHAFRQGQGMMRSLIQNVGNLYRNSLFLSNLYEYLSFQPQVRAPAAPRPIPDTLREGICFEGVRFTYPGSSRPALHDMDLRIPAGKIAAILGPNGSGKSTLVKLVCRLYDPAAGRVTLDGIDLREFDPRALRRAVSVLMQQPMRYYGTAWDNIRVGDLGADPQPTALVSAADAAGASEVIARLPAGGDTQLGVLYTNGVELSAGEWRRVALARALVRQSPVLILDEPTSDMDPWAEAEWLERFVRLAQGRTAIVVTHRLSTALHADAIFVVSTGQVVESGSHDELLERGGKYAAAWEAMHRSAGHARTNRRDPTGDR